MRSQGTEHWPLVVMSSQGLIEVDWWLPGLRLIGVDEVWSGLLTVGRSMRLERNVCLVSNGDM